MNQKPCHSVNPDSAPWHTKPNRLPQPSAVQIASHLGELVQVRLGPTGPVALITLPCSGLVSRIGYAPALGPIMVTDPVSAKARAAARIALAEIGAVGWGGQLLIERPAAPGLGLGSSTAETLGVVRAIARAFGRHLDPEREAAICLAAEAAVDPLMWEGAVLFASREGRVIERLAPISPMRVVGGVGGPPSPTDPKDDKFPDVTDVFAEIVASIRTGYASRVAQAATCSAEANHAHNSNPVWQPLQTLAHRHGALGIAVSHNGPAIALLLPPDSPALPYQELTALGLDPVLNYVLS